MNCICIWCNKKFQNNKHNDHNIWFYALLNEERIYTCCTCQIFYKMYIQMCKPNRLHYNEIMKYPTLYITSCMCGIPYICKCWKLHGCYSMVHVLILLKFEFGKYPCYYFHWQVDMVTPMCSQLTYEGLLDEVDCKLQACLKNILIWELVFLTFKIMFLHLQFLHINNGAAEVDASITGATQSNKKMKIPLNSR